MTSRAVFSLNSNTPCSRRASSGSSLPRCRLCSTSMRISSGEWMRSSSAEVPFRPSSRTTRPALQLSRSVNGRVIHEKKMSGAAMQRLVRSGWVISHALGACSPKTTWRNETSATATVHATPLSARQPRAVGGAANQSRDRLGTGFWGRGTKGPETVSATVPLEVQCTHRAPLREESRRRMKIVLAITAAVMVAEAAGGWLAHSLALLADAGHMLADVAALGLALVVTALAQRPVTAERTFGLLRLEILAALLNGAALIVIARGGGVEAYRPVRSPR